MIATEIVLEATAILAAAPRAVARRVVGGRVAGDVGHRVRVIVLPLDASAWPASRRRIALRHELANVACALYWFHRGSTTLGSGRAAIRVKTVNGDVRIHRLP